MIEDRIIMTKFVLSPNLPQNSVHTVIMSDRKNIFVEEIRKAGIHIIPSEKLKLINGSEAYHADMQICHIGKNELIISSDMSIKMQEKLLNLNCKLIKSENPVTAKAPCLNVCILENDIICNTKTADKTIKSIGKNLIHTNQYYSKCSSAVINKNAVITADKSIYDTCISNKIDVLKISEGYIHLDGYDYGFIGGTCGLLSKNILAFCGNIKLHKDYENIKAFSANYHINLLSLGTGMLYDIGGILPITEK